MDSFKHRCIALRKRGFSLNQIVEKTKRSKTSVYFHIRHTPLNNKRRQEIRLARIERCINYSKGVKGKSKFGRHPIPFEIWNPSLVSLVGHILFDGTIKYGGCVYTNRSVSLLDHVTSCMQTVYPFQPKRYESIPGVYKIAFHNVELEALMRDKEIELTENISHMGKELQRAFLRAFFDDEGSVYFTGKRRAVRGFQYNSKILNLVQLLLRGFGIESVVDTKYNEMTITRQENIRRFEKEINFTKGVCVNGSRSNSVWKQSLEKRELLRRALASYEK